MDDLEDINHCLILRTLAFLSPRASLQEISQITRLEVNLVSEIVNEFINNGWVKRDSSDHSYETILSERVQSLLVLAEERAQLSYISACASQVSRNIVSRFERIDDMYTMISHARRSYREAVRRTKTHN